MTPSPTALTDHLGYWLRSVSNAVSQGFARRLAEREVGVAEWVALRLLHDAQPMPPSRLAAAMGMTRGAVTKLADRLIARGLLDRTASPDDGRAQTLSLTAAGQALVPELAAAADANDAAFFGHLTAAERASLLALLRGIAARHGLTGAPVD